MTWYSKQSTFLWLAIIATASSCWRSPYTYISDKELLKLDSANSETIAEIDALIKPYTDQISQLVGEVAGYNLHAMHVKKPESNLGNLLADYLLIHAQSQEETRVDLALFNTGGFRIPLPPGEVTVGHIMELMPFDNTLVFITMTGSEVLELAKQIIKAGGDPLAAPGGVKLTRVDNSISLSLNGHKVVPEETYRVLTSSYLADGGDNYTAFAKGTDKFDSGILVRDALVAEYKSQTSKSNPATSEVEGRILIVD